MISQEEAHSYRDLDEALNNKNQVHHLYLQHDNNFINIPDRVFELTELKSLSIFGNYCYGNTEEVCNNLSDIQESISLLVHLEEVTLVSSDFSVLPISLRNLKKLKKIKIINNSSDLVDINVLYQMKQLEYIAIENSGLNNINYNKLALFPNLKKLVLIGNKIKDSQQKKIRKKLVDVQVVFQH